MFEVSGDPCLIDMGIFNRYAGDTLDLLYKPFFFGKDCPYETVRFIQGNRSTL
jgi:hypothetical protein